MIWLSRNWDQVLLGLYEHIVIPLSSLVISFVLAFAVGFWAGRRSASASRGRSPPIRR